ncbi:MAG: Stp1/IreP family PP2C-type Ser/Thr phosphatase [Ruminococcaceae bacterium]|nr:Stp1/IreP family PP2C-type Ser/Thr phosphatase [Oscillospiraceae bacterium]
MYSYGKSDVGKVRKCNEDSFKITESEEWVSALVCDGMGGVHGGDIASELAVCVYTDTLFKEIGKSGEALSGQIIKSAMLTAVAEANTAVLKRASSDRGLEGMGTTIVAAFVWRDKAFVINVGDSRLYRMYKGKLEQVTKDHSFVQYLLDNGKITEEEAKNHPNRNVITRALGIDKDVTADFFMVEDFSSLLLCSDGLINYVPLDEISKTINTVIGVKSKVKSLVNAAKDGGGGDNITVVLLMKEGK